MRSPPYSKDVAAQPLTPGHKLLIFAGPKAWDAAKWYRDRSALGEYRESHCLVLPPNSTALAQSFRWPVRRHGVVVVSTTDNAAELLPLFDALQRDGAIGVEVYACNPNIGSEELEWELLCIHWGHPFADPAPTRKRMAAAA